MNYQVRDIDYGVWQKFVAARGEANFLHSWQWGKTHQALGHDVVRCGLYDSGDKLVGVMQGIVMDARRGRYMEIGGGPLLDWDNSSLVQAAMSGIKKLAAEKSCVFVRIRPQLNKSEDNLKLFSSRGLRKAEMHLYAQNTNILNLSHTEEVLLANMRRQTRYEIRQAEKQNIKVESSSSEELVDKFYELQRQTAKLHDFIPPTRDFLVFLIRSFEGSAKFYLATKNGQFLALALVIFYGQEADYFEGASTLEGRKLPGSYAIQWQIIKDAKASGLSRYNLWGVAPSDANENHRFANVSTFKRGFGGEDYDFVPAHDLVINKVRYIKNLAVEKVRRKIRKL